MKLKFHISQITDLDPQIIKDLILLKLNDIEYTTLEVSNASIRFYDNPWVLLRRPQWRKRLDGGSFDIKVSGNKTSVILNYYFNILPLFIVIVLFVMLVFPIINYKEDFSACLGSCCITIGFIKTFNSKYTAKAMLSSILSEKTPELNDLNIDS
jgi:hypothetical protein